MDAVSIASSNRLLEAFERMGVSQGEGLISSGPSPVPEAVSRAFEQLMEQPDPQIQAKDGVPGEAQEISFSRQSEVPKGPDDVQNIGDSPLAAPAVETPLISPAELYHLQFQVAMLRVQADTGSQVTQKTTQGLDSLLRNQS